LFQYVPANESLNVSAQNRVLRRGKYTNAAVSSQEIKKPGGVRSQPGRLLLIWRDCLNFRTLDESGVLTMLKD